MKFQFTAEHANKKLVKVVKQNANGEFETIEEFQYYLTINEANALLEAELAKCERVYGTVFTERDSMGHLHYWHSEKGDPDHTHTALLWNVEKINITCDVKVVADPALKDGEWYLRKDEKEK